MGNKCQQSPNQKVSVSHFEYAFFYIGQFGALIGVALFLRTQRQSQSFQFSLSFLFFSRDRLLGEYVDPVIYTS